MVDVLQRLLWRCGGAAVSWSIQRVLTPGGILASINLFVLADGSLLTIRRVGRVVSSKADMVIMPANQLGFMPFSASFQSCNGEKVQHASIPL